MKTSNDSIAPGLTGLAVGFAVVAMLAFGFDRVRLVPADCADAQAPAAVVRDGAGFPGEVAIEPSSIAMPGHPRSP